MLIFFCLTRPPPPAKSTRAHHLHREVFDVSEVDVGVREVLVQELVVLLRLVDVLLSLLVDPTIVLSGGRLVAVQYLDVVEQPRWEYYSDTILRKVGRYRIGLPYVAAD